MRVQRSIGFGCLVCLILPAACGPAKTYRLPTDQFSLVTEKATAEDRQLFLDSYSYFLDRFKKESASRSEDHIFPVLSSYQLGLALLSAAEGASYESAAHFVSTTEPDEYSLVQFYASLSPETRIVARGSLWLVVPASLQDKYVKDSAEELNFDVVRLGSVGLTAQRAVQKWLNAFDPPIGSSPPELSRDRPIIALGGMSVRFDESMNYRLQSEEDQMWVSNPNRQGLTIILSRTGKVETSAMAQPLGKPGAAGEKKVLETTLDLTEKFEKWGAGRLLGDRNGLQNLSFELRDQGGISQAIQYGRLEFYLPEGIKPGRYTITVNSSFGTVMAGSISIGKS